MKNHTTRLIVTVLFAALTFFFLFQALSPTTTPGTWSYSDLISHATAGSVKSITINGVTGVATDTAGHTFNVSLPSDQTVTLADELKADGVNVQFQAGGDLTSTLIAFLPNLLFLLLIGGLVYWSYRSIQRGTGQVLSFGRSKPRLAAQQVTVTFADVAGVDEAQVELQEIVEFLKTPAKFVTLGARLPKGVLMVGPPGCGKTLLAKAVAGEAGVPFFSISGSEFIEMFVGVGASRVRDLFDQAKKASPCIIFIDEIDAVGRQRGAGLGGGNDERESTVGQLLVEMDGFDTNTAIIVIAATNRPDVLDPALLRPGRFDRHVTVDRPDIRGRRAILDIHARNKPLDSSVSLDILARQTPGFCGADLANLVNEAAILAARNNRPALSMKDCEQAIYRVIAGPERKGMRISEQEKRIVAFHESGHAVVMHALPFGDSVHHVSIISRGSALGWTLSLPDEDKHLAQSDALHAQLAGLLGGRVAEEIVFGKITSGAENDIQKATQLARRMVTQWGMSDKVGPVAMGENNELIFLGRDLGTQRNYSEEMASLIDNEVRTMIENARTQATQIITERRNNLEALAAALIADETVEGEALEHLLAFTGDPPPPPDVSPA